MPDTFVITTNLVFVNFIIKMIILACLLKILFVQWIFEFKE